jgi:transposase InsO family protein
VYPEEGWDCERGPKARRTVSEHSRQKPRAQSANEIWSLDLVADQFTDGRRFRALTVADVYTRECLAIEVGQNLLRAGSRRCTRTALMHGRWEVSDQQWVLLEPILRAEY